MHRFRPRPAEPSTHTLVCSKAECGMDEAKVGPKVQPGGKEVFIPEVGPSPVLDQIRDSLK